MIRTCAERDFPNNFFFPSSRRRGEIIDSIQTLAGAVANTGRRDYKRVVVDCGNYREEREETLKRVAQKLAAKAVKSGKRMRLEPMNPYDFGNGSL